jgi:hypothetical protein
MTTDELARINTHGLHVRIVCVKMVALTLLIECDSVRQYFVIFSTVW